MCGIAGEFVFDDRCSRPNRREWLRLVTLMGRRGPDEQRVWSDDRCLMGFRRLTILDPTPDAGQPMVSPCGRYTLVFNGELYNYLDLRGRLRDKAAFRTRGDSEVALQALIHWGPAALNDFNGMFALALYDNVARTLLLARDHVGMKPLYWAHTAGRVVFASQYDQIAQHSSSAGLAVSQSAVATYLRYGHIPAPGALLDGTEMVGPGAWVSVSADGAVSRGRYFRWTEDGQGTLAGQEADEAIESALRRAVSRQVKCDVAVGCFLSGGVDSAMIASSLPSSLSGPLPVFSVASTDRDLDESTATGSHAARLGLPLHSRLMTDADANALLDDVLACTTEPLSDEGIFPSLIVSESAARHVRVALAGDGGDELFWGYVQRQCPYLRHAGSNMMDWQRYASFFVDMTHVEFESCFPEVPWFESGQPTVQPTAGDAHQAYALRQYEVDVYLPSILLKTDRASMFHSLEVRMPFLDRDVLDVARHLRWDDCLHTDETIGKLPLRRILQTRGVSPPLDKKGFTVPIDRWLRTCLKDRVGRRLENTAQLGGIRVDTGALMRLWDAHQRGHVDRGTALWRLFVLGEWLDRNLHT